MGSRAILLAQGALSRLGWLMGTGLGSGFFPVAPATAGSLVALAIYYAAPFEGSSPALFFLAGAGFFVGVWATGSLVTDDDPDPKRAVWDEFVGVWVTCLLLPKTLPWIAAAFVCFRLLDIVKPWPIRRLEKLPGGWGIMSDDLLAGVYGAVLLNGGRLTMSI